MLKLIKNFGKTKVISTETMTTNEYIEAVSTQLFETWDDTYVSSKTNVKTVFDRGAKINEKITTEEMKECLARLGKLVRVGTRVSKMFTDACDTMVENMTDAEKQNFFSASNLQTMIAKAKTEEPMIVENDTRSRTELIDAINSKMFIMRNIYNVVMTTVVTYAHMSDNKMAGFI